MADLYSFGPYHLCRQPSCPTVHDYLLTNPSFIASVGFWLSWPLLGLWLCALRFLAVYLYRHYIVYHQILLLSSLTKIRQILAVSCKNYCCLLIDGIFICIKRFEKSVKVRVSVVCIRVNISGFCVGLSF